MQYCNVIYIYWIPRLVSTFEDKFLHENYYYEEIGRNIQQKYGELTFKNFIQMILDDAGCRLESIGYCDNHWKTFLSKCGYCDVQYKYFVRSEHFQMDTEYIGMTTNTYFDSEGIKKVMLFLIIIFKISYIFLS